MRNAHTILSGKSRDRELQGAREDLGKRVNENTDRICLVQKIIQ
jgi:hypothetical protein